MSQRTRDGSRVEVSCPSAILTYTKYMGGVDLGDQLREYYCVCLNKKIMNMCFGPFSMYVSQMNLLLLSFVYHHLYMHITRRRQTEVLQREVGLELDWLIQ